MYIYKRSGPVPRGTEGSLASWRVSRSHVRTYFARLGVRTRSRTRTPRIAAEVEFVFEEEMVGGGREERGEGEKKDRCQIIPINSYQMRRSSNKIHGKRLYYYPGTRGRDLGRAFPEHCGGGWEAERGSRRLINPKRLASRSEPISPSRVPFPT